VVISYKDKDFYYIFKTDDRVMYGYKILRFLSHMNSFSELDTTKVYEFTESMLEEEKHLCKYLNRSTQSYRVLGRVVEMKDSEIRLITPVL